MSARSLSLPGYSTSLRRDTFSFLPYPIQGILFLCHHPTLLRFAIYFMLVSACFGCVFTLFLLFLIFPWQVHFLLHHFTMTTFTAICLSLICTLLELALFSFLYLSVLPGWYLDRLFLKILHLHHIQTHQLLIPWRQSCGHWLRVAAAVRLGLGLGTLPLHAVPVLGTFAWAWTNGIVLIWQYHQYWFDTYGLTYSAQKNWVFHHVHEYSRSGILAQALELIPFFNWFFCWTNAIGCALMVVDWELQGERPQSRSSPIDEQEQRLLPPPTPDPPFHEPPPPYESLE